jgi:hypothetical protein
MKTVKDPDALNALAQKSGARVKKQVEPVSKTFTTPKPDPTLVALNKSIVEAGKANIKALTDLKRQISEIDIKPMPAPVQKRDPAINDINENIIKSAKETIKALEGLKKQIKEIPMPEYPESDPAIIDVSKNIVEAERSNVMMLNELKRQVSEIQLMTPDPITRWQFDFIRDDKGYLQKCIAEGQPDAGVKKVLN